MAKEREPVSQGRMLFTDFEAGEKGRPVSTIVASTAPDAADSDFPSIDELAASLGIDFEDDGEISPAIDSTFPEGEADDNASDIPRPVSPVFELSEPLISSAPTWEKFAGSFGVGLKDGDALPIFPSFVPEPNESSNIHEETMSDEFFADGDDEIDILSSLPPSPEYTDSREIGEWRGARLGVGPPPDEPYGGLERLDEWYRPPDRETVGTLSKKRPFVPAPGKTSTRNVARSQNPENTDADASTRSGDSSPAGTARLDPFAGIDLDAAWEERLESYRKTGGASVSDRWKKPYEHFADVDLDAAWRERIDSRSQEKTTTESQYPRTDEQQYRAHTERENQTDAASLDEGGTPGNDDTQFIPDDPRLIAPAEIGHPKSTPSAGDAGHNADEEWEQSPGSGLPEATRRERTTGTKAGRKRSYPKNLEELKIEDLLTDTDDLVVEEDDVDDDPLDTILSGDFLDELAPGADLSETADAIKPPVVGDDDIVLPRHLAKQAGTSSQKSSDAPEVDTVEIEAVPPATTEERPISEEGSSEARGTTEAEEEEKPQVFSPEDVFSNLDEMDFSEDGGLDDDMRAMLEEDTEEPGGEEQTSSSDSESDENVEAEMNEVPPSGFRAKLTFAIRSFMRKGRLARLLGLFDKAKTSIAWRENWWFYLDLLAAIIATASTAIIISYFLWY